MEALITAAALALAAGDPLGALNRIALRDDPPALALRGIAMAQLGDLRKARELVRRAARAFGAREAVARARCVLAEGEIALAARDLGWPAAALALAQATLSAHGDHANAAHAQLLSARRLLLIGRPDEAEAVLLKLDPQPLPPAAQAGYHLLRAGIGMRRERAVEAAASLDLAQGAAARSGIPALVAEVARAQQSLAAPVAVLCAPGSRRMLCLHEVEALGRSRVLLVDAIHHRVRGPGGAAVALARRPVLFALARALAEAWPAEASRDALCQGLFGAATADESHRARLRVEVARLRRSLRGLAGVTATRRGFILVPRRARAVALLLRPLDAGHGALLALLADGESWSSSGLAQALHASQRTVQRALESLLAEGRVASFGKGRACRWTAPPAIALATSLLLSTAVVDR